MNARQAGTAAAANTTAATTAATTARPQSTGSRQPQRLLDFVAGIARLLGDGSAAEPRLLEGAERLLRELVAQDDWLPESFTTSHPQYYQQHLLYGDPLDRFSVVSFVWGPGQATPIHDHTVWGVIGMLRGAECCTGYAADADGALRPSGDEERLEAGDTACVSPAVGDVHRVRNAFDDRVSISIHVYGGNIGRIRRHVFDPASGVPKEFVSGYSNAMCANLWAPAQA